MKTVNIYYAAPLFSPHDRAFNLEVAAMLEQGASVFLPQRDGALLAEMMAAGVPQIVAERRVFAQDTAAMTKSNLLVAVLNGPGVDDGVAFEIGFMHALGKPCVGLQTDVRRMLSIGNNPMVSQALMHVFEEPQELVTWVMSYCSRVTDMGRGHIL